MNLSSQATHRPATARHAVLSPSLYDLRAAHSFFPPAFVLPEQFYHRPGHIDASNGPSALMLAILEDALLCIQRQFTSAKKRDQRLAKEATAWIFNNDTRWPFACANICNTLGIDLDYLRLKVQKLTQKRLDAVTPQRARSATLATHARFSYSSPAA